MTRRRLVLLLPAAANAALALAALTRRAVGEWVALAVPPRGQPGPRLVGGARPAAGVGRAGRAVLLPALSALAAWPLYLLARRWGLAPETALLAAVLWLLVPRRRGRALVTPGRATLSYLGTSTTLRFE